SLQRRTSISGQAPTSRPTTPTTHYEPGSWQYQVTENLIKGRGYGARTSGTTTPTRPPILRLEEPRTQSRSTHISSSLNDGSHSRTPRSHTPSRSHTPLTPLTPIDPERFLSEVPVQTENIKKTGKGTGPVNNVDSENNRKSQGSSASAQEPIEDSDKVNTQPSSSLAAGSEIPNGEDSEKQSESRSKSTRRVDFKPGRYKISTRPIRPYRPEVVVLCPRGSILFMFGFLFPPLWWFGSFFPRYVSNNADYRWKKYNQLMSFVSLFLVAGILSIVIWYLKFYDSSVDTYTNTNS
ncbi:9714_t:CDS:2, partial [Cetraspora pellucida]